MRATIRTILLASTTMALAAVAHAAVPAAEAPAATPAAAADAADTADDAGVAEIVVTSRRVRAVSEVEGPEIQKILPGISPLKALQTLPGVTYLTADPFGNNEQNISLYIHGFNAQQLGYTLDGMPLGDQQYGNYNGLSPQRAVISENVGRVSLASGAGDLGTASTSNLGGTIDTFTRDPEKRAGIEGSQTAGSYGTFRTFLRLDSGEFAGGNSVYVSGEHLDARAWDFDGHQGGWQANAKFVHDDATGKLTLYAAYSDKTEPNEDATAYVVRPATPTAAAIDNRGTAPYTRPFFYPDFASSVAYYQSPQYAAINAAPGSNYRNYYSDAQRIDYLVYAKYDWRLSDRIHWSTQGYYHHNDGVGVVAGPITAAGLPGLFSCYYPATSGGACPSPTASSATSLARLSTIFGGSGEAARTTEYRINREGIVSTLFASLGQHDIEIGGWYERQASSAFRRWYAVPINAPSSPYTRPDQYEAPLITQYGSAVHVDEIQAHIQDSWHILPTVTLLGGFKSTFQRAHQDVPVQPIPGSFTNSTALPVGNLDTDYIFLPDAGALWDVTPSVQVFANAQKNIRQFQTSAAAGLSPFALGSQQVFDDFNRTVRPETSWTYEGGVRMHRALNFGPISGFDGQASYYHVDFSNRLLAISPTTVITSIVSGATILANVGSVVTNGVDVAGTLRFGRHFSIYDAVSYNDSHYRDNYTTGTANTVVPTAGKKVPGSPDWLNKSVVSLNYGPFEVQAIGDYIGGRYATYTNDIAVEPYFTASLRLAWTLPDPERYHLHALTFALNVTNVTNKQAQSTLTIGAATATYNAFPLPPRQYFGTLSFGL